MTPYWIAIVALAALSVAMGVMWFRASRSQGVTQIARQLADSAVDSALAKASSDNATAQERALAAVQEIQDKAKEVPRESLVDLLRRISNR